MRTTAEDPHLYPLSLTLRLWRAIGAQRSCASTMCSASGRVVVFPTFSAGKRSHYFNPPRIILNTRDETATLLGSGGDGPGSS